MNDGYVLCTTPRSGSTLLCTLLAATGRAGRPCSFYHQPGFMREWAEAWGLPEAGTVPRADHDLAYLRAVASAGRAGTPLFGMRLQQPCLAPLAATLACLFPDLPSDAARLERAFGRVRYLHLTRADKVAQAVSLVKARQSGLRHRRADGSELERTAPAREPAYDYLAIEEQVAVLTQADRAWGEWFDRERIEPWRIAYEDLVRQPARTVIDTFRAVGAEPPAAEAITPGLARLSDTVNRDWVARFRADRDGRPTPPGRNEGP